jgi:hypothetical protein
MSTLPRPVIYWDADLVPHPAVILDAQASPSDPAHLLARLFAGPVGELEVFAAPRCDASAPVVGAWSELA